MAGEQTTHSSTIRPTEGPWTVESDPSSLNALVYGKGRRRGQRKQLVAQVWSGDDCSLEVALRNAHLISAAHEMLAALKTAQDGIQELLRDRGMSEAELRKDPTIVAITAAVKKAETVE